MRKEYLYLGAAAAGLAVLYFSARSAGAGIKGAASTLGGWLNPTADTNLAYRGVNAVGSALTGIPDFTLGGAAYDAKQATGIDPWQWLTPGTAIGTAIGTAARGVWQSTAFNEAEVNDARQIDRIIERQQAAVGGLTGVYDWETGEQVGAYDEMGNRIY